MAMNQYRDHIRATRLKQRQESARLAAEQAERNADQDAAHERAVAEMEARAKAGRGPRANKALRGPVDNKAGEPANPIAGIDFASDAAAELAAGAGLRAEDFRGVRPSGATGYTKADVQKLIG